MLEVKDLSFSYGSVQVLKQVSFDVDIHGLTAILGPNGAGKTTLLRCMNRILKPESGYVLIEGRDIADYSAGEAARRVACVAQRNQPGRITVFDAVLLGRKPHMGWRVTRRDTMLAQAALHLLNMEHLALRHTDSMSGGEYQKVCIARAMVQEPTVLLLDEPTASLDLKNQLDILSLLRMITAGHNMCTVVTMHDLNTAFRYADNFLFLKNGSIIASVHRSGITAEIIQEAYEVRVAVQWHQDHPFVLPLEPSTEGRTLF